MMTPCISIRQPWAWAIFHLGKDVETRSWSTPVRGRILIHASKSCTLYEISQAELFMKRATGCSNIVLPQFYRDTSQRGCIIGSVDLNGCQQLDTSKQPMSPWLTGPFGWSLSDPMLLNLPIPYKGRLGFFDVPDSVLQGRHFLTCPHPTFLHLGRH